MYRSRGVLVSGENVYGIRHREAWQEQLPSSAQERATRLYAHLDFLLEQKNEAEADLLRESKKHPIVGILETAPGFGSIRAARTVPIVVTPHRFRTKRQFWSYCGLGVVTRSSSDWVQTADGSWLKARVPQTRGLSRQYNRVLKSIFKGAATTVITQRNKDSILRALRAAPRWRNQADAREAEPGADDRRDGAAHVEGRGGVRPRTSQSVDRSTRKLGNGSIRRVVEKAVIRSRNCEECSHATLRVAAEVSIHELPGPRPTARRSHG